MRMDLGNGLNYGDELVRTWFNNTKKELGFCKSDFIARKKQKFVLRSKLLRYNKTEIMSLT